MALRRRAKRRLKLVSGLIVGALLFAATFFVLATSVDRTPPPPTPQAAEYYASIDERAAAQASQEAAEAAARITDVQRPDGQPIRALFVGDSLAAGYFATSKEAGFRELLVKQWGDVELTRAEIAHQDLATVSQIVDVPDGLHIAVVELGTNDITKETPLDEFRAQYADLLGSIQGKSPDVAIVCAGTWNTRGGQYDRIIREQCQAHDGQYVRLSGLFLSPALRGPAGVETPFGESDNFHPNDKGHEAIAEAIGKRLNIIP